MPGADVAAMYSALLAFSGTGEGLCCRPGGAVLCILVLPQTACEGEAGRGGAGMPAAQRAPVHQLVPFAGKSGYATRASRLTSAPLRLPGQSTPTSWSLWTGCCRRATT